MACHNISNDIQIYRAALHDDWESVSEMFKQDPKLMTKAITNLSETPLMIAVGTNRSHRFVEKLVKQIILVGAAEELFVVSSDGNNPLHLAAKIGNTTDAKVLVPQDLDKTGVPNSSGNTPLKLAAWHGHEDTLRYLLKVTKDGIPREEQTSPYAGLAGGDFITLTIKAGLYDLAYEIVEMHPNIVLECNSNDEVALQVLAGKPEIFPSGSRLGLWGRLIYSLMLVEKPERARQSGLFSATLGLFSSTFTKVVSIPFWGAVGYVAAAIFKNIHDIKRKHRQGKRLVELICTTIIKNVDHDMAWKIFGSTVTRAVRYGTHELIEECILTYPGILHYKVGEFDLFLEAIKQRQELVYNLLCKMSGRNVHITHEGCENAIQIVAKLAPPHRLNTVACAALQMQRELQWFKEVEKFIEPSYKEALNKDEKSPRMVFSDEHEILFNEAKKWMKDTAKSCTVVTALIVTVTFSAIFTVPGGNNGTGEPYLVNSAGFFVYIISDAVALISSSTSLFMFLGTLTSRNAEDDFLFALPARITLGLLSLILSLAATNVAFIATVILAFASQQPLPVRTLLMISAPVAVMLVASVPLPLLMELVYSTFGPSIFYRVKR